MKIKKRKILTFIIAILFFYINDTFANDELKTLQNSILKISETTKDTILIVKCTNSQLADFYSTYLIDDKGYLVGIIKDVSKYKCFFVLNNGKLNPIQLIGFDKESDLAVFKINIEEILNIRPRPVSNIELLKNGEFVIGISKNLITDLIITYGNIDKQKRFINNTNYITSIDKLCTNSIFFDINGAFLGLQVGNFFKNNVFQNLTTILPSNTVIRYYQDIIQYGKIRKPSIGIAIMPLNDEYAREIKFEGEFGILIGSINKNSSAEKSGLKVGDVIIDCDGIKFKYKDGNEFLNLIKTKNINDKVTLTVYRNNQYMKIDLIISDSNFK